MWAARLTGLATVDGLGAFACFRTRASRFHDLLQSAITLLSAATTSTVTCETRADPDMPQTLVIFATRRSKAPTQRGIPVHRRTSFSAPDDFDASTLSATRSNGVGRSRADALIVPEVMPAYGTRAYRGQHIFFFD